MTDRDDTGPVRPSPDALLAEAGRDRRGRLKVFLGAAPGVGKTYAMLRSAQAKRAEGVDVVIGVVETHGRSETEAMVRGLETMPRTRIEYRGQTLDEMDVDAILARRPKLVLVDELAHTNVPGARHPKRYLDVVELLDAGIDVYTSLNIQHLESLNDVVAQITRVRVRETLPDDVLAKADEVELIDLTPDALLQRMKEGKVYLPDQAQRAIRHFFSPGNLTALRELALRRTAERVDTEMVTYMQARGIAGPWPAGDRVLVAVDDHPDAAKLVRAGHRIADRLRAKLVTVYVEGAGHHRLGEIERGRLSDTLRLAERLGAETLTLPGPNAAQAILRYAQANNVTQIVIGKPRRSRWHDLMHGSVAQELLYGSGPIETSIISLEEKKVEAGPTFRITPPRLRPYLIALGSVALITPFALLVAGKTSVTNLSIMYLAAVLVTALTAGLWPAILASVVGLVTHNYFFVPPIYQFTFGETNDIVSLAMFVAVAGMTAHLMRRVREQADDARRREQTTGALYAFSRKLAGVGAVDDLLWAVVHQVAAMLKVRVLLLLMDRESGDLQIRASYPPDDEMGDADRAAARWAWDHNEPAGQGSNTLPNAQKSFLPLRTARGPAGVIGIDKPGAQNNLLPAERSLLESLTDQAAMAIERLELAEDMEDARMVAETERLRSALLTSISHDLRTPLASIIGSVSGLVTEGDLYDREARDELLSTVLEEAERLNRFVGNLLDMTRLESGAVRARLGPVDLGDLVGTALRRTRKILGDRRVAMEIAPGLPMLELDFVLMEQVLVNLLDNAAKYSPAGSTITIRTAREGGSVLLEIADAGFGIAPDDLERVFDKFYRVQAGDRQRAGTGLGLSICRGFVEAQGGTITARSAGIGQGTSFRILLPVPGTHA